MSKFIIGVLLTAIAFITWDNVVQSRVIAQQRAAIQYLLSTDPCGPAPSAPQTSFTAQR